MKYSILIPWRDTDEPWRRANFTTVMEQWTEFATENNAEICIGNSKGEEFDRSQARNNAFNASTGDILIIADADTLATQDGLYATMSLLESPDVECWWGFPYKIYYNAAKDWTVNQHFNVDLFNNEGKIDYEHRLTDSVGGVIMMRRQAFEKVHGYSERFQGWGYEDRAFARTLYALCGNPCRAGSYVVHLWHPAPDEERFHQPYIGFNEDLWHDYEKCKDNPEAMAKLVENHSSI